MYKISVFRIQREILCCLIDFVSLVCLCKSNKLSTQIERVNQFDPFHQIERFNQNLIRKSTSIHHLIRLERDISPASKIPPSRHLHPLFLLRETSVQQLESISHLYPSLILFHFASYSSRFSIQYKNP